MKRYTLADLEEADRNAREGDSGRHMNPGRTRRWNQQAQEAVATIRAALIDQGDLPGPVPDPAKIERERIEKALLAIRPNPDHNEILEFEGKQYRCKYYKSLGFWQRRWEPVESKQGT